MYKGFIKSSQASQYTIIRLYLGTKCHILTLNCFKYDKRLPGACIAHLIVLINNIGARKQCWTKYCKRTINGPFPQKFANGLVQCQKSDKKILMFCIWPYVRLSRLLETPQVADHLDLTSWQRTISTKSGCKLV